MNVMIVVTHLLGTGHLRRALVLADAFAGGGHSVLLASGGMPLPNLQTGLVDILQLPPVRSDGIDFTRLLDEMGTPAGDSFLTRRRDALCAALTDFEPDILITELFPFGRRILGGEFQALLDVAQSMIPRPVILSSVRDILAPPSTPAKAELADGIIAKYYDAVLVHSDPQSTRLEQSWPVRPDLAARLRYTGYVAARPAGPHPERAGAGEIIVSAGGGSVGTPLFEVAIAAARLMPARQWRLLVGGDDDQRVAKLRALAADGPAIVEPARPDFRQMLRHAAASVSLCGYNTALDVLQAATPAVFVPFDEGNEVEQSLRAASLSHLPGIDTLRAADATPERLCRDVTNVLDAPGRGDLPLRFDGAVQSVAIATQMAKART